MAARERVYDKFTASQQQLKHLLSGGVAGAVSRTAVSPLERMKILYQVRVCVCKLSIPTYNHMVQVQVERVAERQFKGIGASLAKIGREEGLRGYFKGNGTNVVRIFPYAAVQFAAYEEFKKVSTLLSCGTSFGGL